MKRAWIAGATLVLIANCSPKYRGDGTIHHSKRTYVRGIAESRGYIIELPEFQANRDHATTYDLAGLPRLNKQFIVTLVTYFPDQRLTPVELEKVSYAVPDQHEVRCFLTDGKTGKALSQKTAKVEQLPMPETIAMRLAPSVKGLLTVRFEIVPRGSHLKLRLEYLTHGAPIDRTMGILIINEAPLL